MPAKQTFLLECPPACSLGPASAVGLKVTEAMLARVPYRTIVAMVLRDDGYVLHQGTLTRHKKHIRVTGVEQEPDDPNVPNATNIEILETIIQKGFANSKNWKPTIADTMKAMDMWFRLTQGNPFDELLNTLASAAIGEEEAALAETNPLALAAASEVESALSGEDDEDELATLAETAVSA